MGQMLESSETDFAARFAEYAASGTLYPQTEGSPLMEFASAGQVLYLFDRTGPYTAQPGAARVVVHGVLRSLALADDEYEDLRLTGVSEAEGQGQVLARGGPFVVVRSQLPLVLGSFEPLPDVQVGDWVAFQIHAPLHGFLVSGAGADRG